MLRALRSSYNDVMSNELYATITSDLAAIGGEAPGFRICETPLFLTSDFAAELLTAAHSVAETVSSPAYLGQVDWAIPAGMSLPSNDLGPVFLSIDFALALDERNQITPRLIEVQGFPSMYFLLWALDQVYGDRVPIAWDGLTPFFSGLTADTYVSTLRQLIVADSDPATVVILDVEPERQKTRIDFYIAERVLGIKTVCATKVIRRANGLWFLDNGREVPISRIFNRIVGDDLNRRRAELDQLFSGDLDVQWVGHPAWFHLISKISLPFVESPYSPATWFLSDVVHALPSDLHEYVLKPLFSYAGQGVVIAPSRESLLAIEQPEHYLLQRRVAYAPAIQTPFGPTCAEIRVMFVCDPEPRATNTFVRMSRGSMMGLDFNKDSPWCGGTIAYRYANGGS